MAASGSEPGPDRTALAPRAADGAFDVVRTVPLSTSDHDRLLGAAFDPANRLYAAGWVADGADRMMAVTPPSTPTRAWTPAPAATGWRR